MAGGKKTGYKVIFCTVVWLVNVSTCGNTIYIYRLYIFREMKQIMQDANSKGIPYIQCSICSTTITNLELAWVLFRKISFLKLGLT